MAKAMRYMKCMNMGTYLAKLLRKRKRTGEVSKKTTIVGSKYSHKLILQAKYKKIEVQARIGAAAKDLGLGRTGGLRRTMIGIKDIFGKARIRANKISYLARKNKRAKALSGTGVLPAATYGAEAVGYSPSTIKQLRTTGSRLHGQRQIWTLPHSSHSNRQRARVGP